jgi:hypothetical protein
VQCTVCSSALQNPSLQIAYVRIAVCNEEYKATACMKFIVVYYKTDANYALKTIQRTRLWITRWSKLR